MENLVPLKSKNYSLHTEEDNFLQYFKHEKICIMDNHRLAFWSWLNFIDADDFGKCAYVHIDYHFDCGAKENIIEGMMNRIKICGIDYYKDLDRFRSDKTSDGHKTFEWGCYLIPAIFFNFFNNSKLYFFVEQDKGSYLKGGIGDKSVFDGKIPPINYFEDKNITELEKIFELEDNIILNIDFDYFSDFISTPNVIRDYFLLIKKNSNKIKFTTVAMTPTPNNWSEAEEILKIYSNVFNLGIEIPLKIER